MTDDSIRVLVDADLSDLIPGYLTRREEDVITLKAAIDSGDFETVRIVGHSMKGSGGGYGFDRLTEIGASLEKAGAESDSAAALVGLAMLTDYLKRLVIVYE